MLANSRMTDKCEGLIESCDLKVRRLGDQGLVSPVLDFSIALDC